MSTYHIQSITKSFLTIKCPLIFVVHVNFTVHIINVKYTSSIVLVEPEKQPNKYIYYDQILAMIICTVNLVIIQGQVNSESRKKFFNKL